MLRTRYAPIILLIADGFDETAVSILAVTLREAGLPVILVGLRSGISRGIHGLALVPDKTLEQLLEKPGPISALVFPGRGAYLTRLQNDPRVGLLLRRCVEAGVMLVEMGTCREEFPPFIIDIDYSDLWLIPEPEHTAEEIAVALTHYLQHNKRFRYN